MTIRHELPADIAAIRTVHQTAFPGPAEADLVDALRDNGHLTISLVAVEDDAVIAHIAFSPVTNAGSSLVGLGLAPVGVLPSHQNHGVGGRLIREGLDECRHLNVDYVVVLGEPEYYGRFGFHPANRLGITNEYTESDAFQIIELRPGAIELLDGLILYGDEFRE